MGSSPAEGDSEGLRLQGARVVGGGGKMREAGIL